MLSDASQHGLKIGDVLRFNRMQWNRLLSFVFGDVTIEEVELLQEGDIHHINVILMVTAGMKVLVNAVANDLDV